MKEFKSLLSYEKALKLVIDNAKEFESEVIDIADSLDRILSEDIISKMDSPPFDRSAMDGYAIQARDSFSISEGSHVTLKVIDSVTAGKVSDKEVASGTAIEIMTGAMIPKGSDSVLMQEFSEIDGENVKIFKKIFPYLNVSRQGEDIRKGEVILKKGTTISPQHLPLLKSQQIEKIPVKKIPRISIIVTGDELVDTIENNEKGKTIDSNSIMLLALAKKAMSKVTYQTRVKDDKEEIEEAISNARKVSDIILITGGSSFGKKDLLPKIVDDMIFHGVTIKPGRPIGFSMKEVPIFIMSGYPVASFVQFYLFVIPYLEKILGAKILNYVDLPFSEDISSEVGRFEFLRCKIQDGSIFPIRLFGSGIISSLSNSTGYVLINEKTEGINKGEKLTFYYYI
ncbi:MAG: molybdopterin molybdotransferase MoeA [Candidatus Methanofastidiosa archaeon]|nr:molybdopterin molybdotransferase MoeA [Candidatus Methanofastidiosa archaeon]